MKPTMRPDILTPLFGSVRTLAGIGPKLAETLGKLLDAPEGEEARVVDLLFHLPVGVIDRSQQPGIAASAEGQIVTLKVRIDRHAAPPRGNRRIPYRVFAHDHTGEIGLVFFHVKGDYLEKTLPVGAALYVSGTVEWFNGRPTMVHPDYIVGEEDFATLPLIEPVYPMTAKLAHIQGSVVLRAVISKDGAIENLAVVSGHPMLVKAAIDAVSQWRYRPYMLNGDPYEVETQVTVNFVLN